MSITVEVGLLSGKTATIKAGLDDEVETLKCRAQIALGVGQGRLADSSGIDLDAHILIRDAGVRNGASLTLRINTAQVQSSAGAFATTLGDGSVVTWGKEDFGGDSNSVKDQLKNVRRIRASNRAFTAILGNGSVLTWGTAAYGGNSNAVQDQLRNVQDVQATDSAFAAILDDGCVVTWGDAHHGGDSTAVQHDPEECAADPGLSRRFCCHSRQWICRDLGQ